MNTTYLLIMFLNGYAMTIEMPDANTCAEMQVYATAQFKPGSESTAKCFPKLGGANRKS